MPVRGGFGTPAAGAGSLRVERDELVLERGAESARAPITTLADAARFAGVDPGVPAGLYDPATAFDPDAPLAVDADGAAAVAAWIAFGAAALAHVLDAYAGVAGAGATAPTLWPEHFDLACELGDAAAGTRANYGAAPGDAVVAEPYLYVGPWEPARRTGRLGAYPFGAALGYGELARSADPAAAGAAFLLAGAAELLGRP